MPFLRAAFAAAVAVASMAAFAEPHAPLSSVQERAIDVFIADEMTRQQIPGIAIGVFGRGDVLLAKGYGFANLEHRVRVKPETVFQSGSVGKQFVSAAIMLLV